MIYEAEIIDGTVVRVLCSPVVGSCAANFGGTWVQTFKNGQRGKYAGIGDIYDPVTDTFTSPEPQE